MENRISHSAVRNTTAPSGSGDASYLKRKLIATKARTNPKEQFNNLTHHLNAVLIEECLKKISPGSAAGVDGMTAKQAEENLSWLLPPILSQIPRGCYEAPAVRRVYVPKADGSDRPIGIPTVMDRAVQAAAASILGEIYEQDFLKCSFGFRPGVGCHNALATISEHTYRLGLNYVLEVDIRDFFGSLSHQWLRKFLELRIGDKRMLKLIDSWLKAGVMEKGRCEIAESGTPQGGSISPLLANIYLHYVLDLWFEKKITKQLQGKARLVRYCDDFVILFQNAQDRADVHALLRVRLGQFGLAIAESKTHETDLTPPGNGKGGNRRSMNFLGFTIFRTRTRNGKKWKLTFQTEKSRMSKAKKSITQLLSKIRHWDKERQAKRINAVLRGHWNYYGIAGNKRRLDSFYSEVIYAWRRALSRRSQNGGVSWINMKLILAKYPLMRPRLKISYVAMPAYARL